MKILTLIILTIFISLKSYGQRVDSFICINCSELIKAELTFEEIEDSEFFKHKKNHKSKLSIDSSKIILKDTTFIIQTASSKRIFNSNYNTNFGDRQGFSWYEFRGFINDLKLYVLENWHVGEFTLGESILIDSITSKIYYLNSLLDGPNEPPLVSPNNKYLISFANDFTSPEGFSRLSIVKISQSENENTFEGYLNFESDQWAIEELIWVTDNSFAIKTNSKSYNNQEKNWTDNLKYILTTIPE